MTYLRLLNNEYQLSLLSFHQSHFISSHSPYSVDTQRKKLTDYLQIGKHKKRDNNLLQFKLYAREIANYLSTNDAIPINQELISQLRNHNSDKTDKSRVPSTEKEFAYKRFAISDHK